MVQNVLGSSTFAPRRMLNNSQMVPKLHNSRKKLLRYHENNFLKKKCLSLSTTTELPGGSCYHDDLLCWCRQNAVSFLKFQVNAYYTQLQTTYYIYLHTTLWKIISSTSSYTSMLMSREMISYPPRIFSLFFFSSHPTLIFYLRARMPWWSSQFLYYLYAYARVRKNWSSHTRTSCMIWPNPLLDLFARNLPTNAIQNSICPSRPASLISRRTSLHR